MSTSTEKPLSVAEVCELTPGDEQNATWINDGFTGVVRKIDQRQTKAGKTMWPCTIADTTGSATVEMTMFTAPKFKEGDQIEVGGKGLRRTEYNGKAQVGLGKATEIHVLGRSVHHEEQKRRAAIGAPSINGDVQPVNGQTVGMAMKEALALVSRDLTGQALGAKMSGSEFWTHVHLAASDIIRVSRMLESGKLAPSLKERNKPKPGPDGSVALPANGEDVEF